MKINYKIMFIISSLFIGSVNANNEIDRSNLAKVITEVDFLIHQVNKIKKQSIDKDRIRFHYDTLVKDLQKIRAGVSSYINVDINNGRIVEPLSGNYR